MARRFTGYHMTGILVAFFGTVAAVNFTMAQRATSTFGGVVVENSYVASQNYNTWLEEAAAQEQLGWEVTTSWRDDGRLTVQAIGPSSPANLRAAARHPLGGEEPRTLEFDRLADGSFLSRETLGDGRWLVRMELTDHAHTWRSEVEL
ncbi:FixH family protein [Erythrobacter alti]|uniref:FixH family protein n=1 Tax=Erythrobacter alti TaxID=1896145 RepID=UPI0030F47DED